MNRVLYLVMAGGRGERLRPLTDYCPKPLLRFGPSGRVIDFTLYNCLASGGGDVVVLTQYLSDMVKGYLGVKWGPAFSEQGTRLEILAGKRAQKGGYRGTADAVYQALKMRDDSSEEYVVVLAGDHVYQMDYWHMIRFHQLHGGQATVGAVECDPSEAYRFGIIKSRDDGKILSFHEKPRGIKRIVPPGKKPLASMGIYVFTKKYLMDCLEIIRKDGFYDFGKYVLPEMAASGEAWTYIFLQPDGTAGHWRDIGDLLSYWQSHMELLNGGCNDLYSSSSPFGNPAHGLMEPPLSAVHLIREQENGARRIRNSLVSENARIEGALVNNSVIGPGVHIEDDALVLRSVILDGAVIRRNARVLDSVVEPLVTVNSGWQSGPQRGLRATHAKTEEGMPPISINSARGSHST